MYKNGDKVMATITKITSYGAFCQLEQGTGLIHISEFSDFFVKSINDFVEVGDKIEVEVLDYNPEKNQSKLSYKSLRTDLLESKDKNISETGSGFQVLQDEIED